MSLAHRPNRTFTYPEHRASHTVVRRRTFFYGWCANCLVCWQIAAKYLLQKYLINCRVLEKPVISIVWEQLRATTSTRQSLHAGVDTAAAYHTLNYTQSDLFEEKHMSYFENIVKKQRYVAIKGQP